MRSIALVALLLGSCAAQTPAPATSLGAELPQVASFESTALPEPLRGDALDDRLRERFARALQAAQLQSDGRLAELALAIAEDSDAASRPPSYPVVSYHARRVGLAEPTPQVWLASGPNTESLAVSLERAIAEAARTSRLTHAGAAAARVPGGVVMALALSNRAFALRQPVPRQVAQGSDVRLEMELAAGYGAPTIAVTDPEGRVTRESLGPDARFIYTLHPARAGEYTLELLASGPEGLTVVAIVPVMVGRALEARAPTVDRGPVESDARAVTEHLLRAIRDERKKRKLPALAIDVTLTSIALAHSQDMVEHGFIAHTSKRTGDATARIARAGLKPRLVLENIGRGYSASELHRGLMESPGHRGNILHPDARQIGIGVVAEREGDRYAFIATELFTQLPP
ncbi:MAG TPA: CAP domain-containing protein [Polyangiales bacterium]|nr:CAP domain-containing protein [Polyangiales bacterium]